MQWLKPNGHKFVTNIRNPYLYSWFGAIINPFIDGKPLTLHFKLFEYD